MSENHDYENLFKRLLMMNQFGVYLTGDSGHVWIEQDDNADFKFQFDCIALNNKIYGGVVEAIDTFDGALRADGQATLIELWNDYGKDVLFIRYGGIAHNRIDFVEKGRGGIF